MSNQVFDQIEEGLKEALAGALIYRLKQRANQFDMGDCHDDEITANLMRDAASELTRMAGEIERLKGALSIVPGGVTEEDRQWAVDEAALEAKP